MVSFPKDALTLACCFCCSLNTRLFACQKIPAQPPDSKTVCQKQAWQRFALFPCAHTARYQRGAPTTTTTGCIAGGVVLASGPESLLYLVKLSSERRTIELRTRQLHSTSQAVDATHHEADVLALKQIHRLVWKRDRTQTEVDRHGRTAKITVNALLTPRSFGCKDSSVCM